MIDLRTLPFGQITGKVGDKVYFKTRQGYKMRDYVIPIQPNSDAQYYQRGRLGNYSSNWTTRSNEFKRRWNNYASKGFLSRTKRKRVTDNGHNAYVSASCLQAACNATARTTKVYKDGLTLIHTSSPMSVYAPSSLQAPNKSIAPFYNSEVSGVTGVSRMKFNFEYFNDQFGCRFSMNSAPNPYFRFKDNKPTFLNSTEIGFFVMASNSFYSEPKCIRNPEKYLIGATRPLNFFVTGSPTPQLAFKISERFLMSEYYNPPIEGQYVYLTLYGIDFFGTHCFLHRQKVQITAY
jgi:hypothetical protein